MAALVSFNADILTKAIATIHEMMNALPQVLPNGEIVNPSEVRNTAIEPGVVSEENSQRRGNR